MLVDYLDSTLHVTRLVIGEKNLLPGPPGKICARVVFSVGR
jgi:hypothetical protein